MNIDIKEFSRITHGETDKVRIVSKRGISSSRGTENMQLRSILSFLSLLLFIRRTLSEAIAEGPSNRRADVGSWANFTCSVSCDHLINWFVEGYPSDISTACSTTHNNLMVCKQIRHECRSGAGGASNYSETLRVLAKAEHEGSNIAVQCAAVSRSIDNINSCSPFITYSRFALLSVNDLSDSTPTPTPCTTEPQDVTTITETVTVTEIQAAVTVTETVTVVSTVVQAPSASPPPLPAPNSVTDSRRTFGKILSEMFMWAFTIGVGVLFASMAVLR